MSFNLPPNYTIQTKTDTVQAVLESLSESVQRAERAKSALDFPQAILACAEGYYYAGFACGLTIVSSSELDVEKMGSIEILMDDLIDIQKNFIRKEILLEKKMTKYDLQLLQQDMKIPDFDRPVDGILKDVDKASILSGWENPSARESLIITLVNQLKENLISCRAILGKKKITKDDLAEFATLILNSQFMFGTIQSLKFTRYSDFEEMKEKHEVLNENKETVLVSMTQYIDKFIEAFNKLDGINFLSSTVQIVARKPEPVKQVKQIQSSARESSIARFFSSCIRPIA